ncbi:SixA phosphatase family protein [Candidatus Paracaedibacter symbiosus]|uniref:SixA phosphatase family protein n=1 Tax=Candidatus Paracaedibacter symbiosus TaxID=244582 RepID=UPI00068D1137|nr:hypothetical protein [Candidatus Paracaedibacter symbiosus]
MRKLFILRHADTMSGSDDKIRSLSKEGWKELKHLKLKGTTLFNGVDMVLCSSSTRTRQTLEGIADILPDRVLVSYIDALYHASSNTILEEISLVDDKFKNVLVIGHNSGVTDFMYRVCDSDSIFMEKTMRTANIAEYTVKSDTWRTLRFGDLQFIRLTK